jgi:hypothetical protein
MTDPRWFDVDAIADAGNMSAAQMQAGFSQLRPTAQLAKWVTFADKAQDPDKRDAFVALETWASDNIAFPAEAYRRYIRELYQENLLVRGEHAVRGERVDLGAWSRRCSRSSPIATRSAHRRLRSRSPSSRAPSTKRCSPSPAGTWAPWWARRRSRSSTPPSRRSSRGISRTRRAGRPAALGLRPKARKCSSFEAQARLEGRLSSHEARIIEGHRHGRRAGMGAHFAKNL